MSPWERYGYFQTSAERARGPSKPRGPGRTYIAHDPLLKRSTVAEGLEILRIRMEARNAERKRADREASFGGADLLREDREEGPG